MYWCLQKVTWFSLVPGSFKQQMNSPQESLKVARCCNKVGNKLSLYEAKSSLYNLMLSKHTQTCTLTVEALFCCLFYALIFYKWCFWDNKIFVHEILAHLKDRTTSRLKRRLNERRKVIETSGRGAINWKNKSQWWEEEKQRERGCYRALAVKLMYDRRDWCCLSDTSELNVVRRRQMIAETIAAASLLR